MVGEMLEVQYYEGQYEGQYGILSLVLYCIAVPDSR
jgi:hypothetical protein